VGPGVQCSGQLAVLEAADIAARAKRTTVADLRPVIDAKKRAEAHRWEPTQAEIDRVMLDLLGGNDPRRRHIPYVKKMPPRGQRVGRSTKVFW